MSNQVTKNIKVNFGTKVEVVAAYLDQPNNTVRVWDSVAGHYVPSPSPVSPSTVKRLVAAGAVDVY